MKNKTFFHVFLSVPSLLGFINRKTVKKKFRSGFDVFELSGKKRFIDFSSEIKYFQSNSSRAFNIRAVKCSHTKKKS